VSIGAVWRHRDVAFTSIEWRPRAAQQNTHDILKLKVRIMSKFNRAQLWSGIALSLGLAMAAPAFAQSTSAALNGRIIDPQGQAIPGATVEIVHVPSGSRRTVVADAGGRFDVRGLRVGGPYTVTSTAPGSQAATESDVFLRLDEVSSLSLTLAPEATALEAVEVVASASTTVFSTDNMGARTNITREEIEAFPSIKRSIDDYVRFDPRVVQIDKTRGGLSAGGQNNRYNNIRIDGVPTNDQFGLNDSGVPALNQPISIDWIEEFNVGISNYDVTQSDFVGANINAVTKSGGNEFEGGVYGYYRNDDMVGEDENGNEFRGFEDEWQAGAYVGGPIIEDVLFFFVGYERFERSSPAPDFCIQGQSCATVINLTQAQVDQVVATAQGYGWTPGATSIAGIDNTDDKYFVKLDWNINENHRAWFRYNKTEGSVLRTPGIARTVLALTDHFYEDNIAFESYSAGLYSNWSDSFSSEFNISYSEYDAAPSLFTRTPQVNVTVPGTGATIRFGSEQFRHANALGVDTLTAFWAGDWFLGDHTLRFGFDVERNDIFNLFLESSLGRYTFNSPTDFANGRYAQYVLRRATSGNSADAAADWTYENYGWFLQDTWTVTSNLTAMFGFRVDINQTDDVPELNPLFVSTFGFANNLTVDDNQLIEPRIGFNYTFDTERPTQLRGGIGLFQGSSPGVWLSNNFTNTGTLIQVIQDTNGGNGVSADPSFIPPEAAAGSPAQDVDSLDRDFTQPSVWKWNVAFEHELPWMGIVGGVEYLVTDTREGIFYEHLNLGAPVTTLPDGRQSFWSNTNPASFNSAGPIGSQVRTRANSNSRFNDVLLLRNTDAGRAENITVYFEKPWRNDWYARFGYTYGDATDVNPGTSSRAISNWNGRIIFNPNEEIEGVSNYEIQDRLTGLFSKRWRFFENAPTTFALFYEGRDGRPYSYAFLGDANGDRINGNDLFYIPRPGDVQFTSASTQQDIQAFFDYIENTDYLSENQGTVASRNALRAPWVHQFDVRLSQEIPLFGDTHAELFLDILNIGNLFNDEWGQIDQAPFPYRLEVARFAGVTSGQYVYDVSSFYNETTNTTNNPALQREDGEGQSRWAVQVGFRFEF
jgi:hypothetical protein